MATTVLALSAMSAACGADGGHIDFHNCDPITYNGWDGHDLRLNHLEPRNCALDLTYVGEKVDASGVVEDWKNHNFNYSILEMYNSNWVFKGNTFDPFEQTYEASTGEPYWYAQVYMRYEAGTGTDPMLDHADYWVSLGTSPSPTDPTAQLDIFYEYQ